MIEEVIPQSIPRKQSRFQIIYDVVYDSIPQSMKSLWNTIVGSEISRPETEIPLNRIERYMRIFIVGSLYYLLQILIFLSALFIPLIISGLNVFTVILLIFFQILLMIFYGLLNSALSSRVWRFKQSGKFGRVVLQGLALTFEMTIAALPGLLLVFDTSDRFIAFVTVIGRFLIYAIIFGILSRRFGKAFSSIEKGALDVLPKYLGDALKKLITWKFWKTIVWAGLSVILAILVSTLIMVSAGYDPGVAFGALVNGAIRQFDRVLFFATPLIMTGLSVALAFKCGLFNIGAEGQVYMGSIAAAGLGALSYWWFTPPENDPFFAAIHLLSCLGVGILCGFLWGLLPGLLKSYRGAHEVVTTMMLSYTAVIFTTYLASGPWKEIKPYQYNAQTPPIDPTAVLGLLWGSDYLNGGFIIAIIGVVVVWFVLNRTVLGYEMRAVGLNVDAAEYSGINPKWRMALALALSGALAGLAGASEILGQYHRFYKEWSPGLGWDGITVAVLGYNNPWGCLLGAIFFGFLRAGGNAMHQTAHVPPEMVNVIQGLVVLFVAAPRLIQWMADHGFDYAKWLIKEPKRAVPPFITMIMGLFATSIAFIFIVTATEDHSILIGPIWIAALLSLIGAISMLGKHKHGTDLSLLASVGWIGIGLFALQNRLIDVMLEFFSIGFLWLVICIISLETIQRSRFMEAKLQ